MLLALLFMGGIFFLFLTFFFLLVIRPIINHKVSKKSNKIQWKCENLTDSDAISHHVSIHCNKYYLYYRTLPSELNKCVKIFGDNPWIRVKKFNLIEFENRQQFIDFVKQYETREQIERVIEEEDGWIYP